MTLHATWIELIFNSTKINWTIGFRFNSIEEKWGVDWRASIENTLMNYGT
jgi:hypothetical protein